MLKQKPNPSLIRICALHVLISLLLNDHLQRKMSSQILYYFSFVGLSNSISTNKYKELNGGAIAFSVHFHDARCVNQVQLRVFCSSWLANIVVMNALSSQHVHFKLIPYKLIEFFCWIYRIRLHWKLLW